MKKSLPLKTLSLLSPARTSKSVLLLTLGLALALNSFANRVETFVFGCVFPGNTLTVDAIIVSTPSSTWYHWQYKDNSGAWKCFINGTNNINGVDFTVSGATSSYIANDAPLLTIASVTTALENVEVRVLMRDNADPCGAPAGTVYGGDDLAVNETKYLRLHVYSPTDACAPNSYTCAGNTLSDAGGYYGGFENKTYEAFTDSYAANNFISGAGSSDFASGTGSGHYQDIDNPFAMNAGFTKDIAPHTGNFQLVVQGSANTAARAWYKSGIPVTPGTIYTFAVYAARVDMTDPVIALRVVTNTNVASLVATYNMNLQPVGNWWRISGNFTTPVGVSSVTISVSDDNAASGANDFSLDDICFRACSNCSPLPLHRLDLSVHVQGNKVDLKWIAENEMNTRNFIVQRSVDGVYYSSVGTVPASGQTNIATEYNSTDDIQNLVQNGVIYYRILAEDNDGRYGYSNIIAIRLNKKTGVQVWPNPFESNISITYNAAANTTVNVSLMDNMGKIVRQSSYTVTRGLNQLSLNDTEGLPAGIYFIRVTDKNSSESFIQKLAK